MKIDFLAIYHKGEAFLEKAPFLNQLHQRLSQSILNWSRKHNLVRFDNLRAPDSTDDDIKKCSAIWFTVAGFLAILLLYNSYPIKGLSDLIALFLFFFIFCFVPYAIGVINLEALKIIPKIDPEKVKEKIKIEQEKRQIEIDKKIEKIQRVYYPFSKVFSLAWGLFTLWVLYLLVSEPETLKRWVDEYHLHNYVKGYVSEDNTYGILALLLILGPACIHFLLLKIVAIFILLFSIHNNSREI